MAWLFITLSTGFFVNATVVKAKKADRPGPAQLGAVAALEDVERDQQADLRRDEAISELQKIIPTFDESPQKAELYYRLAELYWDKAKFIYFTEFRAYDQAIETWNKDGRHGEEPKLQSAKSDALKRQAISVYDQVLAKYPDYPRADEVLFRKASSMYEAGDKKDGVDIYFELIKRFPKSDYLPDTYLALGEHYFNNNELGKATTAYQKAVQTNKAKIYAFALYKLAWCDYNAQDYAGALSRFKQVVEYSEQQAELKKKKKDRVQLRQEALKDMLLSFAQMDAIDEAKEYYLTKEDRLDVAQSLGRLGQLYEDQGKWDLAVKTYRLVIADYPDSPRSPQYQSAIVNAYAQMQKRERVRDEAKRLIAMYKPGSAWATANKDNKQARDEAFELTERALRELTTEIHAEAQKTKEDKTYGLARDLYREYLEAFAQSEHAYKMRFNYAEILFRERSYERAAEQYDLVAAENPRGKYLKDAAFTSVQAWELISEGGEGPGLSGSPGRGKLKDLGKLEHLKKGGQYPELAISDSYKKLAEACERFVKVLPNDPDVVKVKFKEARIFFVHHHFEEASKNFLEIVQRWPNDKLGRLAATFVLEGYSVREQWQALIDTGRDFLKRRDLTADVGFAREVSDMVEGASFKLVQSAEQKGDLFDAALKYRAFAEQFPRSKYAETALYNAMVIGEKANALDIAIAAADRLVREYPSSLLHEKTLFQLGGMYERAGELDRAVKTFQLYQDKYPKGSKIEDADFNVAVFLDTLGANKAAIAAYEAYRKKYPKDKDAQRAYLKIAAIYERTGDWKRAAAQYDDLEKQYRDASVATQFEAKAKAAKAYKILKAERNYQETLRTISERYNRVRGDARQNERVIAAAAQARFELFEPTYQAYLALKLQLPQARMLENLKKKSKQVGELEREYAQILAIGNGDFGIAALTRIGMAYQDFSKALFDAPVPSGLTEDQREIYMSELQNKALPIEEKAIEAYEKAVSKAHELRIYNDWTLRAQERLAAFKPSEFPEVHRFPLVAHDRFLQRGQQ